MNIFSLINNGATHIVHLNMGNSFEEFITKDKSEYDLLIPNQILMDRVGIKKLMSLYYIDILFDLSNCYTGIYNEPYSYWHLSKAKPAAIKTSKFYGFAHPYRDDSPIVQGIFVPDKYNPQYEEYVSCLEKWIQTDVLPEDKIGEYQFNEIYYDEFDSSRPYADYYLKRNAELRESLRTEKTVLLQEIAEIVQVYPVEYKKGDPLVKVLDCTKSLTYPYSPDINCTDHVKTTELIHKGDIILCGKNHYFLVDKDSDFDLYAPVASRIIRAKTVSPEYLYFYLNSDIAKKVSNLNNIRCGDYLVIGIKSIGETPVILPKNSEHHYKEEFLRISSPDKRYYLPATADVDEQSMECLLVKEISEKIKVKYKKQLRDVLDEDFVELGICCNNKAYKAALILAGSIMEAFIIDWVSEIKGVNCFDRPWTVEERDENGQPIFDKFGSKKYRDATLMDYINILANEKKEWAAEYKKAHNMRTMRNLVHPRRCLERGDTIDESTCRDIIQELKDIVYSRLEED